MTSANRLECNKRYKVSPLGKLAKKRENVKRNYGITLEEYESIIDRGCEICGTHEGKLCVDHCHETLKIRGCLCDKCNLALGHYEKFILPNIDKLTNYLGGVYESS